MLRLQVRSRVDHGLEQALAAALARAGAAAQVQASQVFWLQEQAPGALAAVPDLEAIFHDPISQDLRRGTPTAVDGHTYAEIRHRPGVTDNLARTATEALMIQAGAPEEASWQDWPIRVLSGWLIDLDRPLAGALTAALLRSVLDQNLTNPLLHAVDIQGSAALQAAGGWFAPPAAAATAAAKPAAMRLFPLTFEALQKVNAERGLALSAAELQAIIAAFRAAEPERTARGWDGCITEVELECIAQSWSEHCKHKIFAANIDYSEAEGGEAGGDFPPLGAQQIRSLYKTYVQAPTRELQRKGWLVSVFSDNAGIVDFDPHINVCIKVETHNSPSALDPYGGAITGILGVNRDIIGCGLGAKPVANMDVFCLSAADRFPPPGDPQRPLLLKDPAVIFRGVHKGVEDGGNQSGIPTVEGGLRFASEYGGKPLVFVGSVGVMPKKVGDRPSQEKKILPGDLIVVAGGRLGKDGVHGATFSSLALGDDVAANVVQIGDPITQKRLLDFTLAARDRGLIRAITDNGAGGLSSSVGEMAELCGGARLDLSRHAVKYPGLAYWEMLVSESQERMSYAVAPEHLDAFLALAHALRVEAWALGEFTASGRFDVEYAGQPLARLPLAFLHDGAPRMQLRARYLGPQAQQPYYRAQAPAALAPGAASLARVLQTLLASPNVASREFMVRRYDHEVQAATRLKPFTGRHQATPSDAGVIDLGAHGGRDGNALVIAHGLCPQFSAHDTFLMAHKAVDAALRNIISAGGDPDHCALVDNFCWPDPLPGPGNPDAEHKLGQLVRACAGIASAARAFGAPFVSGKDSMKNDFAGATAGGSRVRISVPPTLLVTAMAQNPQADRTVSAEFKRTGDRVYVVGALADSLYGSEYADAFTADIQPPAYPDLAQNAALYRTLHGLMQRGLIASCHSVQEGGLLVTALESCFGNRLGLEADLAAFTWPQLFSEAGSAFVLSVQVENSAALEAALGAQARPLGRVTEAFVLHADLDGGHAALDLAEAEGIWSAGVRRFYDA